MIDHVAMIVTGLAVGLPPLYRFARQRLHQKSLDLLQDMVKLLLTSALVGVGASARPSELWGIVLVAGLVGAVVGLVFSFISRAERSRDGSRRPR